MGFLMNSGILFLDFDGILVEFWDSGMILVGFWDY